MYQKLPTESKEDFSTSCYHVAHLLNQKVCENLSVFRFYLVWEEEASPIFPAPHPHPSPIFACGMYVIRLNSTLHHLAHNNFMPTTLEKNFFQSCNFFLTCVVANLDFSFKQKFVSWILVLLKWHHCSALSLSLLLYIIIYGSVLINSINAV